MDWEDEIARLKNELDISPGDLYEDSALHPCLCVGIDYEDDDIWGVSLIDGSYPRSCSLLNSGVRKISVEEAWSVKKRIQRIKD